MKLDINPGTLKFKRNNISKLLDTKNRWQSWLEVEGHMSIIQSKLGIIPKKVGKKIYNKCNLNKLNSNNIKRDLKKTGHKLVPLILELSRVCSEDAKKFVHWGATTQNIVQTGDILILKEIHKIFLNDISLILEILGNLAIKSKDFLMVGRTHGQHALPITFGFKVASWIDEISRHIERINESEKRVFTCRFGGAVGTAASFGKYELKIQNELAKKLKLKSTKMPVRTHMDHIAEYILNLIMTATTFGKIGQEIYNLMKSEVSELEEPISKNDIGSSTMPQKRNPHICQDLILLAAECRTLASITFESMMNEHEGSRQNHLMSNSALNQSCIKFGEILSTCKYLFKGLKINSKKMKQNLEMSKESVATEAIMLKLGKFIGRAKAHEIIHSCYNYSFTKDKNFLNTLKNNNEVKKYLNENMINKLINPNNYIGLSKKFSRQQSIIAIRLAKKIRKKYENY